VHHHLQTYGNIFILILGNVSEEEMAKGKENQVTRLDTDVLVHHFSYLLFMIL